jgi:uncharacterized membrane protein
VIPLTGMILFIAGWLLYKRPPKKINMFYGYRTKRAMSSQKMWDISQSYSGKLMAYVGIITTIAGIGVWLVCPIDIVVFMAVLLLQCASTFVVFPLVEGRMKKAQ